MRLALLLFFILFSVCIHAQTKVLDKSSESYSLISDAFSLHTNFIVPMTRFNFLKSTTEKGSTGRLLLFNSIGAGIGISKGELSQTFDQLEKEILSSRVFRNHFGLQLGFLFSTSGSDGESKTIFAPTISFSFLDFQLGYGIELGDRGATESGHFMTISYGIPLYKLSQKASWFVFPKKNKHKKQDKDLPHYDMASF